MIRGLLIGIDGGGTHSSAVAFRPDGEIVSVAYGGGMNFHNDGLETVRSRLKTVVQDLCSQAGAPAERICAGLSALDGPADERTLALFAAEDLPADKLDLQSDAYIALMGYTLGAPGMIAICGTGSMLLLMDRAGRQHVSGGWGYLLEDAGSGFTLAREALLAVAAEADGTGPETGLMPKALEYFGADTPRGLIEKVYAPSCGPDRIAGFARSLLEEADRGNRAALGILERNMDRLAFQAVQLFQKAPGENRIGLYGGIFSHSTPARRAFEKAVQVRMPEALICDPVFPPEIGAVIHLLSVRGELTDAVLRRMRETWKEISV